MNQREIKFRAWDKEEKKMYYDVGISPDGIPFLEADYPEEAPHWLQGAIPLEFTGLKDKNGKEIFEKDILKDNMSQKGVVEYHGARFTADNVGTYFGIRWSPDCEVIGNIYENPELLK